MENCVPIPIVDDTILEMSESFSVAINSIADPAVLTDTLPSANVLIFDDDSMLNFPFQHTHCLLLHSHNIVSMHSCLQMLQLASK